MPTSFYYVQTGILALCFTGAVAFYSSRRAPHGRMFSVTGAAGRQARLASSIFTAAAAPLAGATTPPTVSGSIFKCRQSLAAHSLVLASASPRRREIFDLMRLDYEVVVSTFPEDLDKAEFAGTGGPGRYAETNAVCKAAEVMSRLAAQPKDRPWVVVGSDTIVDLDGVILEKPKSEAEARATLRKLSGRPHLVHSGVGIFTSACGTEKPAVAFHETTTVYFGELSDDEIAGPTNPPPSPH